MQIFHRCILPHQDLKSVKSDSFSMLRVRAHCSLLHAIISEHKGHTGILPADDESEIL